MKTAAALLTVALSLALSTAGHAYEPKKKSNFSANAIVRNPFWPIGWKPGPARPVGEAKKEEVKTVTIPPDLLNITSIQAGSGGRSLAVINKKTYLVGDKIKAEVGGRQLEFQVIAIRDGVVVVAIGGKQIEFKLNRREPTPGPKPRAPKAQ